MIRIFTLGRVLAVVYQRYTGGVAVDVYVLSRFALRLGADQARRGAA